MKYHYFTLVDKNLPLFLGSIGHDWEQYPISRPNGYPYFHWIQSDKGSGVVKYKGNKYILEEAQGILLESFVPHEYWPLDGAWKTSFLTFGGTIAMDIFSSFKKENVLLINDNSNNDLKIKISEIHSKLDTSIPDPDVFDLSADVYTFLMILKRQSYFSCNDKNINYQTKVYPLLVWLEQHYMDSIGVDDMAKIINVSPQYLSRLFKKYFNISPYAYLRQLRISKAKRILIMKPSLTIAEVAKLVGYLDTSHFILNFREQENLTPLAFRKLH
ncbi:AraC family transcriptional regulator [Priestia megaterium]|uniref:AraC family transcriptional regulator n=1 Tax=Priestia megaterium TaxID=1404 RepID=UPI00339B288A